RERTMGRFAPTTEDKKRGIETTRKARDPLTTSVATDLGRCDTNVNDGIPTTRDRLVQQFQSKYGASHESQPLTARHRLIRDVSRRTPSAARRDSHGRHAAVQRKENDRGNRVTPGEGSAANPWSGILASAHSLGSSRRSRTASVGQPAVQMKSDGED